MKIERTLTFKDYIAGAVLANSLAWLTLGIMPFFGSDLLILIQFLFLTYMIGAIMAGYLVTRKAFQDHTRVGLKTGLGAFIFHVYVFMGVIDLISGERLLSLWEHLLILVIFISGGFVGAFLCKQLSSEK